MEVEYGDVINGWRLTPDGWVEQPPLPDERNADG